jgi:hypothetical protein
MECFYSFNFSDKYSYHFSRIHQIYHHHHHRRHHQQQKQQQLQMGRHLVAVVILRITYAQTMKVDYSGFS